MHRPAGCHGHAARAERYHVTTLLTAGRSFAEKSDEGRGHYVGNCTRADMLAALEELAIAGTAGLLLRRHAAGDAREALGRGRAGHPRRPLARGAARLSRQAASVTQSRACPAGRDVNRETGSGCRPDRSPPGAAPVSQWPSRLPRSLEDADRTPHPGFREIEVCVIREDPAVDRERARNAARCSIFR
jgi:hypothetical protein